MFEGLMAIGLWVMIIDIVWLVWEALPQCRYHLGEPKKLSSATDRISWSGTSPEPVQQVQQDIPTSVHYNEEEWELVINVAHCLHEVIRLQRPLSKQLSTRFSRTLQ